MTHLKARLGINHTNCKANHAARNRYLRRSKTIAIKDHKPLLLATNARAKRRRGKLG